ncbi:MAG: hypothetical protein KF743_14325 [Fimbriimonadaceae bacterium]|nr:hypothetical protein [Fimbriimonadaceae bacterium]
MIAFAFRCAKLNNEQMWIARCSNNGVVAAIVRQSKGLRAFVFFEQQEWAWSWFIEGEEQSAIALLCDMLSRVAINHPDVASLPQSERIKKIEELNQER